MFGLNIIIALQNQSIKAWPLGMASREVNVGREGRVGRGEEGTLLHRRYLACTFFALHTVYLDIWQLNCTFFAHLLSDLGKQAFQRD